MKRKNKSHELFGTRVRRLRQQKHISSKAFAEMIGVGERDLKLLENNSRLPTSNDEIRLIKRILGA